METRESWLTAPPHRATEGAAPARFHPHGWTVTIVVGGLGLLTVLFMTLGSF